MGTTILVLSKILTFLLTTMLIGSSVIQCSSVTYDKKAIVINGHRRILLSGSIHYPRSTPEMWEDLIKKAKDGGLDVIDTYVFWNGHEPSPGTYNFEGRYDLVRFIKTIQEVGLYVHLRIGPYVCAEWNFGGFPVWLKYVDGISFRTDNGPFKSAMQGFTEKIVQMMKEHRFFASQGGPIILSQIENEFEPDLKGLGPAGHSYVNWAAKMAVGLNTGVPWVMCKEDDAPDPIINTCNGFYCDYFTPNKPYKPTMWTEAWSGWFTEFGGTVPKRPVEDLAFGVARFIQKGGSYINYYMYHGGTNFGRTAGGPFITTSYDYDAPIDEYGLVQEPKYSHLKQLHQAIKQCEAALVSSDPHVTKLGNYEEAHVFTAGKGSCVAFLTNYHMNAPAKVVFNNRHYTLPAWSISILPDCRNVVFNTATVAAKTSHVQMVPSGSILYSVARYDEDIATYGNRGTITARGLLEQVNVTRDTTDYLWYTTSVDIKASESFLRGGKWPTLTVDSAGHAVHVFVNGHFYGSAFGTRENRKFSFSSQVNLRGGANKIALLSVAVGLPNVGPHFETWATGIVGSVVLHGLDEGNKDLSWQKWTYQAGLRGESMNLVSPTEDSSVDWIKGSLAKQNKQPLTWYKAYFPPHNKILQTSENFVATVAGLFCILVRVLKNYWKMGSGQWHMEKRSTLKNDSFVKEYNPVTETGSLSIIVLGASGDLAKKKTFPALFNLFHQGFLNPDEVHIFGYARSKITDEELRDKIRGYLVDEKNASKKTEALSKFLKLIKYVSGPYDSEEGFKRLDKAILEHEISKKTAEGSSRRLFYLALPPSVYPPVSKMIKAWCTNKSDLGGWTRIVVEKPFGKDLESAEQLSSQIGALFEEPQIYRIDHYLGKELVQNMLVLRFANRLFLPLWNRDNIANVQIVFREDFGTEGRGGYFDEYGIIRDIIQNHLLQVLCLVAMEKPISLKPEHIRDEKVKVLQSVIPIKDEEVVLGQYEGYRDDPTVPNDSNTPTFATTILRINNERWEGVPFILKAGKAMSSKKADIRIQFKDVPGDIFKCQNQGRNEFVIRLQPSEAMYMKLTVKQPGLEMQTVQSELDLSYKQRYQDVSIPEAYERLILDTIRGDQQHFVRRDELKAAWEIFTPLLHRIDKGEVKSVPYKQGSRGPAEADQLLKKAGYMQTHGYIWIPPTL